MRKKITNEFGNYSRQVLIEVDGRRIQCDYELATEISYLNLIGIKTVASCSGHGIYDPWIAVEEEDEERMMDKGYTLKKNEFGVTYFVAKLTNLLKANWRLQW